MNCEHANGIDMVGYLAQQGHQPTKINGNDYWYLSPLREEKTPSFKVNRRLNVWYDHGIGKGGGLVDFGTEFHRCSVQGFLQKLSSFHTLPVADFATQNTNIDAVFMATDRQVLAKETAANSIEITRELPWFNTQLLQYLNARKIDPLVASVYAKEVWFKLKGKEFFAVGFKNNAGGFELRNENFKGSSSPKYPTFINNNSKELKVFEGSFDFLSYLTLLGRNDKHLTDFLVLNSLSFFEKGLEWMQKYDSTKLYLDNDIAGRKCVEQALKTAPQKFEDGSKFYQDFKDVNEFLVGKNSVNLKEPKALLPKKAKETKPSKGHRL